MRLRRLLHQMLDRVQRLVRRPGADIQLRRETVVLRRIHRAAHQLVQALALARADRHHRHAQPLLHGRQVDDVAVAAHLVHHVEGYHHRPPQLEQLKGQVEVAFKVGGVHDVDDHVGLLPDDEVAADDFLHRIGAEGIDARQIHDGHVRILIRHRLPVFVRAPEAPRQAQVGLLAVMMVQHRAGLFFDRHAGPVAHVLAAAGELVEEGGFAAVLVTGQGKGVLHEKVALFCQKLSFGGGKDRWGTGFAGGAEKPCEAGLRFPGRAAGVSQYKGRARPARAAPIFAGRGNAQSVGKDRRRRAFPTLTGG